MCYVVGNRYEYAMIQSMRIYKIQHRSYVLMSANNYPHILHNA